jgi:hypothetical protein
MVMMNRRHSKGFGRMKEEKEKKTKKKEKEEENKLVRESEENSSSLSSKDEAHSTQNILVTNVKRKSADYDEDKKDEDKTTTRITTTTTTTTSANTNTTRNCRICMCEESRSMPFVQLGCTCKGAMAFAHKVLKRFFSSKYYRFDFLLSLFFLLFVLTIAFKIILHITS